MTGQKECVEALLQRGASVCVRDVRGRTPVHLAAACGRLGALGVLLQAASAYHAPTQLTDSQGYTPLHWACYNGTPPTQTFLYGPRPMTDRQTDTDIFWAYGWPDETVFLIVMMLLQTVKGCISLYATKVVCSDSMPKHKWSASCPPHKQAIKKTCLCRKPMLRDRRQKHMVLPTTQMVYGAGS